WSHAACAADSADDLPRASMIALPRSCTVLMNAPCSHASSPTAFAAGTPAIVAWCQSGYCVLLWLPQIVTFLTSDQCFFVLPASGALARFWSSRVIAVKRSGGTPFAFLIAIRQFVLHGLPTTTTRTSPFARSAIARPWPVKILPLSSSRSLRSMSFVRGLL